MMRKSSPFFRRSTPSLTDGRRPELLLDDLGGLAQLPLVPELREHDVPGEQRHQRQHDEGALGDEVALLPRGRRGRTGCRLTAVASFSIDSSIKKSRAQARHLNSQFFSSNLTRKLKQSVVGVAVDRAGDVAARLARASRAPSSSRALPEDCRDGRLFGELAVRARRRRCTAVAPSSPRRLEAAG